MGYSLVQKEPGGKAVKPVFEPVYGALLLAFEKNCPEGLITLKEMLGCHILHK